MPRCRSPNPPVPRPRPVDSDEAYLTLDDIAEPAMLEPSFTVDESPESGTDPQPPARGEAAERGRAASRLRDAYYGDLIRIFCAIRPGWSSSVDRQPAEYMAVGRTLPPIYGMLSAPCRSKPTRRRRQPAEPRSHKMIRPHRAGGQPSPQTDLAGCRQCGGKRVVLYEEDRTIRMASARSGR